MDEGLQCDGMMALGSRPGWLTFKAHARAGAGAGCPKPGARSVSRSKAANGMAFVNSTKQKVSFFGTATAAHLAYQTTAEAIAGNLTGFVEKSKGPVSLLAQHSLAPE